MGLITFNKIQKDPEITSMLRTANDHLGVVGYTEHGVRHGKWVGRTAQRLLRDLGIETRQADLAGVAGYMHDLGNIINREDHAQSGAQLAFQLLREREMDLGEITTVISAIGNHHEEHADPVNNVSAALILADKADVHRSRVRNPSMIKFDIHDRVNYAVQKSDLSLLPEERIIRLSLRINTKISQVMEYFEIFLSRMIVSRRAADFLNCTYELFVNDNRLL